MILRLHVLSGGRAGLVFPLSTDRVVLGRHADADVRFSAEEDLHVSARHAEVVRAPDGWRLRDLGSLNGTFLNGQRLDTGALIGVGDRISLGQGGPVVVVERAPERVRQRASAHFRIAGVASAAVLLVAAAAFLYGDHRQRTAWEHERAGMQQRMDSVLVASERTIAGLQGQLSGLADALRQSDAEVRHLRDSLSVAESRGDARVAEQVRRRLQAATATLASQQRAAVLDYRAIQRSSGNAVARVFVESQAGQVVSGTAFAVRPDALLLTSRHVVVGADGHEKPKRIAVQFANSEQVWPARLVSVSGTLDLAALKVDNIVGDVPTIHGWETRADTLPIGTPVALIGFPGGGIEPREGGPALARPVTAVGLIRASAPDRLELEGYGAEGASGSPIFDARGAVVGVLFGGRRDRDGQRLFAVPAGAAARFAASVSSR